MNWRIAVFMACGDAVYTLILTGYGLHLFPIKWVWLLGSFPLSYIAGAIIVRLAYWVYPKRDSDGR